MNCTHADTLIQLGLDGRLTPDERTRLDAHLDRCPACRAAWDEHRHLARVATDWTRQPILADDPGDAFTAQVMAQIAHRPTHAPQPLLPPLLGGRGGLPLAVFLLALTGLSIWTGPLLLARLPMASVPNLTPTWDPMSVVASLQMLTHLPQDALDAWSTLTAHPIAAPAWLWSVLAVTLALNVAFVWRARFSSRTEATP